jgi:cytochrome c peroxidase
MKKIITYGIASPIFIFLTLWSCGSETSENIVEDTFSPTPYTIPEVAYFPKNLNIPIDNPMTVEGVDLGRYLFYDGRLSGNSDKTKLMSCATCHIQENGFEVGMDHPKFTDGKTFGLTDDGSLGPETPNYMLPIVNTVYNHSGYFWNGFINESNSVRGSDKVPGHDQFHYRNIESVVWMSITAEHEMNSTIEKSVAAIDAILT